ncbi:hypothetical protein B738_06354 [Photorhabdus temperata subsp. temperata M1021]|nr:hypothetical protein B738_06354 [Photorhabdus temperata subsp. temperata M1021]
MVYFYANQFCAGTAEFASAGCLEPIVTGVVSGWPVTRHFLRQGTTVLACLANNGCSDFANSQPMVWQAGERLADIFLYQCGDAGSDRVGLAIFLRCNVGPEAGK